MYVCQSLRNNRMSCAHRSFLTLKLNNNEYLSRLEFVVYHKVNWVSSRQVAWFFCPLSFSDLVLFSLRLSSSSQPFPLHLKSELFCSTQRIVRRFGYVTGSGVEKRRLRGFEPRAYLRVLNSSLWPLLCLGRHKATWSRCALDKTYLYILTSPLQLTHLL